MDRKEVLISTVKNGWMVTNGDPRNMGVDREIYVFTKWGDMMDHIHDDLTPDDPKKK